jgi:hypothetical protein
MNVGRRNDVKAIGVACVAPATVLTATPPLIKEKVELHGVRCGRFVGPCGCTPLSARFGISGDAETNEETMSMFSYS